MRFSVLLAGAAAATLVSAQATDAATTAAPASGAPITSLTPNQSSAIQNALLSYAGSLLDERDVRQLGLGLALNRIPLNSENLAALNPVPTSGPVDWVSFANTPPSITATPTWLATVPAETRTSVSSIQVSALNRAVNIVRAQLSLPSTTIAALVSQTQAAAADATNAAGSPARMGVAEGMLGAAAVGVGLVAAAL